MLQSATPATVCWFAGPTWKINGEVPNGFSCCVIIIVCEQLANVAAGRIMQTGVQPAGDPRYKAQLSLLLCVYI